MGEELFGNGFQFRATIEGTTDVGDLWAVCEQILRNSSQCLTTKEGGEEVGDLSVVGKEICRNGLERGTAVKSIRYRNGIRVVGEEILGNGLEGSATLEGIGEVGEILLEGDIDFFVIEFRHNKFSTFITGNQFLAIRNDGFAVLGLVNQLYISARRIGKIILDGLFKSPPPYLNLHYQLHSNSQLIHYT